MIRGRPHHQNQAPQYYHFIPQPTDANHSKYPENLGLTCEASRTRNTSAMSSVKTRLAGIAEPHVRVRFCHSSNPVPSLECLSSVGRSMRLSKRSGRVGIGYQASQLPATFSGRSHHPASILPTSRPSPARGMPCSRRQPVSVPDGAYPSYTSAGFDG